MKKRSKSKKILIAILFLLGLSLVSFGSYLFLTEKDSTDSNAEDDAIFSAVKINGREYYVVDDGESYVVAYHSVLKYGADPTGKKDSSDAFNKALQAAEACTNNNSKCGNLVYVPAGTYKINSMIRLKSYTGLIGAGVNKTFLNIYHGQEDPYTAKKVDVTKSAVYAYNQSSIRNLSFYYPNQKVDKNGNVKPYYPTVVARVGVEIENVNFINSYIAMDFSGILTDVANNSLYFINNVTGTPLKTGIINSGNLDTIRISNLSFNSSYWHKKDKTNQSYIKKALLNEKIKPSAIELQRVDWAFLSKINIQDYYNGIYLTNSAKPRSGQPDYVAGVGRAPRDTEGELFDSVIKNCKYPINVYNSRHFVVTSSELSSAGGSGFYVQNIKETGDGEIDIHDVDTDYSIYDTKISSTGANSISFGGKGNLSITNSTITGKITKINNEAKMSISGSKMSNTGMDGCNYATTLTYTKPTDYANKVVRKPTSTSLVVVDGKKLNKSFTQELKDAINKLKNDKKNKNGGIIYIPTGLYTLTESITVPSGIEIVGSTPWMHNGSLLFKNPALGSTRITLNGKAKINLSAKSGLNGLEVLTNTREEYAITGSGKDIYIRNVSLPGVKNGIKVTGDNFLIEHIWGAVGGQGINVNGNNGIIRECHFTKNARLDKDNMNENLYINNNTFVVQGSNNIVFDDFTFGPATGFTFNNATNIKAIGIGSDSTALDVKMNNVSGIIINPMLVSNHKLKDAYYVYSEKLKGKFEIINPILWSADQGTKIVLRGNADIHLYGGIVERYEGPAVISSNPSMIMSGLIFKKNDGLTKLQLESGAKTINVIGNICNDTQCTEKIDNQVKANVGKANPITSCPAKTTQTPTQQKPQQPQSGVKGTSIDKSPAYAWTNLTLSNTTVNNKTSSTTVCGLGKTYTNFVYSTSKDKEKTVKISNGCATISITPAASQYLKYKLTSNKAETELRTVQNVGKYLIYAQVYNKFLYVGSAVSNNSANLGGWVGKNTNVSQNVLSIGTVAVNNSTKKNNTEFVKMLYKGILGRDADKGGQQTWENYLKTNSRSNLLKKFIETQEAKNIYTAWGYK